jgi:hypothetical protein
LEDVFRRWARLGSSEYVVDELEALLRSRETRSAIRYVYAGEGETGEQVTCRLLDGEFWKNYAYPLVDTDSDGVDHIAVHYTDHSLADRTEFFVRAIDAERHEGLYFPALVPRPPPPPVEEPAPPNLEAENKASPEPVKAEAGLSAEQPPQELPKDEDKLEDKAAPDSPKTGYAGRLITRPLPLRQQAIRDAVDETFPDGWDHIPTGMIMKQAGGHSKVQALKPAPDRSTWLRALDRRKD